MKTKNMTVSQFDSLRRIILKYCIRKETFCDGTVIGKKRRKRAACPYYQGGRCQQPDIAEFLCKGERNSG